MPDRLYRIRLFVSCPEEMRPQAAIVEGTARDLSPFFEDTKGLTLKVLNWRRDVAPGIDADPQARLNAHLKYDIYVGLLGTRFGEPTARAGSGTEDEFEKAYASYVSDSTAVRLLFYFKKDVADVSALDVTQLGRIQAFRRRLSGLGVLYGDYASGSELEDLLKQHLRILLTSEWDERASAWRPGAAPSQPAVDGPSASPDSPRAHSENHSLVESAAESPDDDETPGALDYAVQLEATTASGVEALTRLTAALTSFGAAIADKTSRATELNADKGATAKQKQQLVDASADDLRILAHALATDGAQFRATFDTAVSTAYNALAVESESPTWNGAECLALDNQLASLSEMLRSQRDQTAAFATSTTELPNLTRHIRAAKRVLSRNLSDHVLGLTEILDRTLMVRRQLRQLPGTETLPPLTEA